MIFTATIWPPAISFADEIVKDIEQRFKVVSANKYATDKDNLRKIVLSTYKPDKTPRSRINRKLKVMLRYKPEVMFIFIELENPTMLDHKKARLKDKKYCQELKKIKSEIRELYAPRVKDYLFDVIVHFGDNEEHTNLTNKIIRRNFG